MAARNTALMMKPTGYKVNLMSAARTMGLKVYQGKHSFFILCVPLYKSVSISSDIGKLESR